MAQKQTLNVLLIEDSADYAALVQQWLSASEEGAFLLNWTDSLSAGLSRLIQGGVDVVLLDLGLRDSDGAETYLATRSHAPGVPVIILSAADSESLALRMIQEGAEDYLVKSSCTGELLVRAVRYAVLRRKTQAAQARASLTSQNARIVGVLGSKGGVGTSTVACYLAAELRRAIKQEVLFADLDLEGGIASFLFGLEPKYSMRDAVQNLERLDRHCWDALVTPAPDGMDLLASPRRQLDSGDPRPEEISRVLSLVQPFYRWIVVDLGRLNVISAAIAPRADQLLLVATPSLVGLYQAKRALAGLADLGAEAESLRVIINHTEGGERLSPGELKTIFGLPVYAVLPQDREELHRACLARAVPNPESGIGRQLAQLARSLAGVPEEAPHDRLPQFLSFMDRFRKSASGSSVNVAD